MSDTITVKFAERSYQIVKLPIRANREWRQQFDAPLTLVMDVLNSGSTIVNQNFDNTTELGKSIIGLLASYGPTLIKTLTSSVDLIVESLFAYSPALTKDREWIETHATDEQAIQAFIEVLTIAYPFGQLIAFIKKVGQEPAQTQPSLPEQNGDSGKTS